MVLVLLPSLEPSRGDGSNEGSQHMFILRNTPQPRYNTAGGSQATDRVS